MKFKLVYFVLVGILLTSCSKEDDGIYFDEIAEVEVEYSAIELEIFDLINEYRESIGVKPLEALNIISSVAESHTEYMIEVGQINHDFFAERQENLVKKANAKAVGENVAYGYSTARGAVNGWLNSDAHRRLIEKPQYTHFGISTEQDSKGRNFFTQMFIER
ncbi:CAP domain-containing protein [Lutibacter sp. B1]|uniref:CAP domain-containing protein n=1 Tax=Lutibacter sp. B1 TaxID=2725996 RepID=UPI001456C75F|nr:CAP domain-containing protein [Lutibacter sp. B1]NLP59053.1 CAP domain-containing protein [Lutibacter sp. B1]